ncbi:MAG TPA: efflux transporter outer membrane subunit [Caulobacteraceae bacterium]
MPLSTSRWPILGALILLGGCAAVGPNFQRPAAPTAASYAMAGDPSPAEARLSPDQRAAGPWWRALGSRDLDEVMAQALAGNLTVRIAVANLAKAQAQAASARDDTRPQVDAAAGIERARINTQAFGIQGFPSPTINLFSIGGDVSYDLDLFGGLRRRLESARAARDAEARRADAAYLTVTANVAVQAAAIATLRSQIAAVSSILGDDEEDIAIVRRAQAQGGEAPSASVSGEAQLAEDRALAPPLEQQLAQARHALALLAGRSPAEWTAPAFSLDGFTAQMAIPLSLPSALVRRRPDILAAEADLHQAIANVGVANANLYPDIKLTAGLTQTALTPQNIFSYQSTAWDIGAGLTTPIFHGGALRAQRRAAEAQARASLAQYEQTVLTAFVQVSDVLAALAQDDRRVADLAQARRVAESGLRDTRVAYRLGGGALLPVVEAQRQLNRTRLALAQAQGERLTDVIKLYAATAAQWR